MPAWWDGGCPQACPRPAFVEDKGEGPQDGYSQLCGRDQEQIAATASNSPASAPREHPEDPELAVPWQPVCVLGRPHRDIVRSEACYTATSTNIFGIKQLLKLIPV